MNKEKILFIIVTGSGEDYGWSEHSRMTPFEPEDNIDVAIVFWGGKEYSDSFWKSAKYIHKQKGNKFHLLRDFFAANPNLIEEYDNFFIMDDDIYMSRHDILLFMYIFKTFDFDLACPGFYREAGNSRFAKRRASIYRTLNTVDVGAWCMNKRSFLAVLPIMNASLHGHGWGIPEWWLAKYHDRNGRSIHGGRIGCIDAAGAEHTRKMGADITKLREGFGSQGEERNYVQDNFIGYRVDWWREIEQYEYMTGEKLKEVLAKVNSKS
jgi:hypothetical protein